MNLRTIQHLLAHGFMISACGTAAGFGWGLGRALVVEAGFPTEGAALFWFSLAVLLAAALGWMIGAVIVWRVVFRIAGKLNGTPFQFDDTARILVGSHRNRVTRIYEIWDTRGELRAWIDDEHKKAARDVFGYHEVCRERLLADGQVLEAPPEAAAKK